MTYGTAGLPPVRSVLVIFDSFRCPHHVKCGEKKSSKSLKKLFDDGMKSLKYLFDHQELPILVLCTFCDSM